MVNLKNRKISVPHIVVRYLNTIKDDLKINYSDYPTEFYYNYDSKLNSKYNIPENYYCISLGATHFTKRIPNKVLQNIIQKIDFPVVLIGGDDVLTQSEELTLNNPSKILNLCGKLSIKQSAQIIDKSELIITADTGTMHIAAALNKKIHVLWGNTTPAFGMYPYIVDGSNKPFNYEVALNCRPCSKIGFKKCPKGNFKCMLDQDDSLISKNIQLQINQSII
ncbi:MAG: glycosyltransferase family 9 protein [Saprospiraceae bacterium]